MNSLEIIEFKNAIRNYIASKEFPSIVKQMVLSDVLFEISKQTDAEIENLYNQRQTEQKGEE